MMLSQVNGSPQAYAFEPWMFFYISVVLEGKEYVDWAKMISDNIDEQFKNLRRTKTFYMSSYVIYMLARMIRYKGLTYQEPIGCGSGQFKIHDACRQLHLTSTSHFKRVNDAFTMYITRTLQWRVQKRISKEAQELIEEYGFWFVQFPKFTYLRLSGHHSYAYQLPRYPTNRMIMLEVSRQLIAYDKIIRKKKRGLHFPIVMGNSLEECPSLQAAKEEEDELQFYHLTLHTSRQDFDP